LQLLTPALDEPTRRGKWKLELDFDLFTSTGGMLEQPDVQLAKS
jgi:hypothetical protein